MDINTINKIFIIFSTLRKNPRTELIYVNNFTLTVAVVLSAQSTDISVNKATSELFKNYQNPEDFLILGESNLKKYIKTIGLYNTKAKNIIALSKILVDKYNSKLPENFNDLINLPGVGRKTANVILNCAFQRPTMGVDTHVARVSRRVGLTLELTTKKIEMDLLKKIPKKWLKKAHNWLILHGRYICKSRNYKCKVCSICHLCNYNNKNL